MNRALGFWHRLVRSACAVPNVLRISSIRRGVGIADALSGADVVAIVFRD